MKISKKTGYRKIFRTAAAAAVILIMLSMLCGCAEIKIGSGLSDDILFELNELECPVSVGMLALFDAKYEYESTENDILWERNVGSVSMDEYVKNSVKYEMIRDTACQLMANELTVFLDDEDMLQLNDEAEKLYNKLSARYDLAKYGISLTDAEQLIKKRTFYDKVYAKLSENISMEISDSYTKVICIDQLLVPLELGYEAAEAYRGELKAGNDFEKVCTAIGLEADINVVVKRGDLPSEIEDVAYALKDDEISEVIQTEDGYYIIHCVEDYMVSESVAHSNEVLSEARREKFEEAYTQFAAKTKISFNDKVWDEINIKDIG